LHGVDDSWSVAHGLVAVRCRGNRQTIVTRSPLGAHVGHIGDCSERHAVQMGHLQNFESSSLLMTAGECLAANTIMPGYSSTNTSKHLLVSPTHEANLFKAGLPLLHPCGALCIERAATNKGHAVITKPRTCIFQLAKHVLTQTPKGGYWLVPTKCPQKTG
jgi:hypothetical protein